MESTRDGYKKTARHFEARGLTEGMIKGEVSRRRRRAERIAEGIVEAREDEPSLPAYLLERGRKGGSKAASAAPAPPRASKAKKPSKRGKGQGEPPPALPTKRKEPPAPPAGHETSNTGRVALDPASLPEIIQGLARSAMLRRLAWLASPKSVGHREQRNTAITLGVLIDKFPNLLKLLDLGGEVVSKRDQEDQVLAALSLDREDVPEEFTDEDVVDALHGKKGET